MLAAGRRLKELTGTLDVRALVGVELHADSARAAVALMADEGMDVEIEVGDFFATDLAGHFDAVIGNPPYIRYQDFSGQARARSRKAALALGVKLTGLSSSWAAFVVHATRNLAPNGRLGLVLPAELLSVNYASEVREFLLRRFGRVRLVAFDELLFRDALEDVVLLLAEGSGSTDQIELYRARNASRLRDIDAESWTVVGASGDGKWMTSLIPEAATDVYTDVSTSNSFVSLAGWGHPYLGAVTGNNRWFTLSTLAAVQVGLTDNDLLRISPPGSRHLRGLTFTSKAWDQLCADGRPVYLFRPTNPASAAASKRITEGEESGVHNAYKCRVREPWWLVPLVEPPDLFFTYMNHLAPQLVTNRAGVHILNSVHGMKLQRTVRQIGMDLLPMAMLNSVTLLGAELIGRAYGGGMLKLEPREAARLPLPSPALVESKARDLRSLRPQLTKFLQSGDLIGASVAVDRVLFRLHPTLRRADLVELRRGREALFGRRKTRGESSRGSNR